MCGNCKEIFKAMNSVNIRECVCIKHLWDKWSVINCWKKIDINLNISVRQSVASSSTMKESNDKYTFGKHRCYKTFTVEQARKKGGLKERSVVWVIAHMKAAELFR